MDRVERRAAVHPGVQVALTRPDLDVDADEAAGRELDRRHVAPQHPAVEDHAGVGPALVLRDPVGDRVAADLLLAVVRDAEVDRQRARLDEPLRGLEDEPELALVVGDSPPVRPFAADVELERVGLPELERRGRLHVEVVVDEDRRRVAPAVRRRDLAERELALAERRQLGSAADAANELANPLAGALHVLPVGRVGAHARDRDQLRQLGAPGLIHGERLYGDSARRRRANPPRHPG